MSNTESADTQWYEMAKTLGFVDEKQMWEQLYNKEHRPVRDLAYVLGYSTATIVRRLALSGVKKRSRGGPHSVSRIAYAMAHLDQRWLRTSTLKEIADLLGVSSHSVYRIMKEDRI